jgi:hypothetical protein
MKFLANTLWSLTIFPVFLLVVVPITAIYICWTATRAAWGAAQEFTHWMMRID